MFLRGIYQLVLVLLFVVPSSTLYGATSPKFYGMYVMDNGKYHEAKPASKGSSGDFSGSIQTLIFDKIVLMAGSKYTLYAGLSTKSGKKVHVRTPITDETVKPLVKAYYDVKGEWKGLFVMQSVERIRLERINRDKIVAHVRYIYRCIGRKGCSINPNVGKDQRRFWLAFDGNKWRVTKMGGANVSPILKQVHDKCSRDFLRAIESGNIEMAKLLYEDGVDINCSYAYWKTPLMAAVAPGRWPSKKWSNKHKQIAAWLLSKGTHINLVQPQLRATALIKAVEAHNLEAIKFLIGKGADVNILYGKGDPAFNVASTYCYYNIAEYLISKGANVTSQYRNTTALYSFVNCATRKNRANRKKHIKLIRFLLDKGVNPNIYPKGLWAPIQYAKSSQDIELYKLLKAHGAK